ncbi:tryptophan dimethylallyltransferase 1 [Fusarium beomiforme]|uniref:Tryptophan dimethylallyltransferase 1 n=1 Tax=Fusarium beomiforme TaxID=44412 RepID=A0A9P5DVX2_9HYPO|nr:tryptophan dimethylallyltransferase 1 [Fusarium beomiforme]
MLGKLNSPTSASQGHKSLNLDTKIGAEASLYNRHWDHTVGCTLAAFLKGAGYDSQSRTRIQSQFSTLVAPYLGSSPAHGVPRWKSFMTDNHCPVELSWDFHTGINQPTIRYSIEPISLDAGTASDPYNERAAVYFRQVAAREFPSIDTTLFDHFEAYFNRRWSLDMPEGHHSTMFWAFDLKENSTTNKAYFFPGAIAHAMGKSALDVVTDAITSSAGFKLENISSLTTFARFVNERRHLHLEMDMLALDLLPLEKTRLKIYFRDRRTDFTSVEEMMSLGGRVRDGEFDIGMRNLRHLWDALLGTRGVSDDVPLRHNDHRTAGILYNVEFRTGSTIPKVKVYIPVRHYSKNDAQIIEALRGFLADQVVKQPDVAVDLVWATRYSDCLHSIFGEETLSRGLGVHTYIGCSIESKGDLRVVAYVNPLPYT